VDILGSVTYCSAIVDLVVVVADLSPVIKCVCA